MDFHCGTHHKMQLLIHIIPRKRDDIPEASEGIESPASNNCQ